MSYKWLETADKISVVVPPGGGLITPYYNVAGWLKPHTQGGGNAGTVFHHGARPALRFDASAGSRRLRWEWLYTGTDANWRCDTQLTFDTWVHVFVGHDGRSVANKPKFYLNGVEATVTTQSTPSGSPETFSTNWIGSDGGTGRTWNGWMDDLAFWGGRLLALDEIKAVYLRGAGSVVRSRVLHYPMRLIVDGKAMDASGNGRHGTVTGLDVDADNGFRGLNVGSQLIA